MKVGTDGVLLGAWCRIEPADKAILDIGTGTGVIALMLAQRTEAADIYSTEASTDAGAIIEAVEIDPATAAQAGRNFAASPWANRLKLYAMPIQEFAGSPPCADPGLPETELRASVGDLVLRSVDHIVSNPPYFVDSLVSPSAVRNIARHTESLSYEDLISVVDKLLKPEGRLSLVLPTAEAEKMAATAAVSGFVVSRRTEVHSTPKSGVKRVLLEFSRQTPASPEISSLIIEDAGPGSFSAEYRALTRDFYLYF